MKDGQVHYRNFTGMFQVPKYVESMSVKLSEVLSDIGVNERIVLKRRRLELLAESMYTRSSQLQDHNVTTYNFGSRSEGTTTIHLESDSDALICLDHFNVIQYIRDWKPGVLNYLMIQDDTVSPGYCLLTFVPNKHFVSEREAKTLIKNKVLFRMAALCFKDGSRHGPAQTVKNSGISGADYVFAFPCKFWPLEAKQWLDWQGVGQWPSADLKRDCISTGCFIVPVGSKGSKHKKYEYRISTSLAERYLMFSLNITQIRCYILMKIIVKTFIKPHFKKTITSYMCKTVLFHCIANTHSNIWREYNILGCLSLCLFVLHTCIMNENCPHFIIPGNNLMKGKIPRKDKPFILKSLCDVVANRCKVLLEIECDDLGLRLQHKMDNLNFKTSDSVSGNIIWTFASHIEDTLTIFLNLIRNIRDEEVVQTLLKYIHKLDDFSNQCKEVDNTACQLLKQGLSTCLGTALASRSFRSNNIVSARALTWIFLGLNTDVSSSKLKLASIYYCTGDIQRTEITLMDIEKNYDVNSVEPVCICYHYITQAVRKGFAAISHNHKEEDVPHITAFCVKFLPYEIKFVPHELQFEMLRSTNDPPNEFWIKWAVVDSLPYLYFLQYKIYKNLQRHEDIKKALSNLLRTTAYEPDLRHRETALNLLGQCMEQEDRATDALRCYLISLNLREKYNAARIHICRLLSSLITNK